MAIAWLPGATEPLSLKNAKLGIDPQSISPLPD